MFDMFLQFTFHTFLHSIDPDITPPLTHGCHGYETLQAATLWSQDSISQACQHQRGVPDIDGPALAFHSTQVKILT